MKWFRFYNETLSDPKIQQLPDDLFRTWVAILCLASKHGGEIPVAELLHQLSHQLSHRCDRISRQINALIGNGLLEQGVGVIIPHNWYGRQYKSDNVTERTKKHKAIKRNVPGNGGGNVLGTAPDKTEKIHLLTNSETEPREAKKEVAEEASKKAVVQGGVSLAASPYLAAVLEEKGWVRK